MSQAICQPTIFIKMSRVRSKMSISDGVVITETTLPLNTPSSLFHPQTCTSNTKTSSLTPPQTTDASSATATTATSATALSTTQCSMEKVDEEDQDDMVGVAYCGENLGKIQVGGWSIPPSNEVSVLCRNCIDLSESLNL